MTSKVLMKFGLAAFLAAGVVPAAALEEDVATGDAVALPTGLEPD